MKKIFTFLILLPITSVLYSQITNYPYVQTGGNPIGWSVSQTTDSLIYLAGVGMNPSGVIADTALIANFRETTPGANGIVKTPVFNFTNLSKPVMFFYVAYRSRTTQDDSMQALVSTNGGVTFQDLPTPYRRSFSSTPSLATIPSFNSTYVPTAVNQWRHETIDLTSFAGMNNIMVGFRMVSAGGNNLYLDNFIVTNISNYCQSNVTSSGDYNCSVAKISFSSIGLNPPTGFEPDNPSGGMISFSEHANEGPVPSFAPVKFATNTTATTGDGSIFTPNIAAPDNWFTITYTGNDRLGNASYSVTIDVTNFISLLNITKLYIMRRSDLKGSWECLNTTATLNTLTATGLNQFSDFAVGGDSNSNPLPVELASFTSTVYGNDVSLNWSTISEINNSHFSVERFTNNVWQNIGTVTGNGTSSITHNYSFMDRSLSSGRYNYRLKQIDFNGNFEYFNLSNEVNIGTPVDYRLSQNYPNPFNPATIIRYEIPSAGRVSIKVFDMTGREVTTLVDEVKTAGYYSVNFNASNLASGIYTYRITSGNFSATKKMMLVK